MPDPLEVELLTAPITGRTFYECVVGQSTAGDGYSAYCLYRDHIVRRDPWTIYEINLQTEQVIAYHGQLCDSWFLFRGADGCIYTFPEDTEDPEGPKAYVARINPRVGELEIFGPGSPDSWNYCWCWGPGECMYIGGWRLHNAMQFDPATGEFLDYGAQGPQCKGGIYHIACDGTYLYTTMGGDPFYLVAMDLQSGDQRILRTLPHPQRLELLQGDHGVFARLQEKTNIIGEPVFGQAFRLDAATWMGIADTEYEAALEATEADDPSQPEVIAESPQCQADGTATLWYRHPGADWRSVEFVAGTSKSYLFRLGTFGDGKVVCASEDPYTLFQYDPATSETTVLGPPWDVHVYAFAGYGEKGYFVGYCGAPVLEWDPQQPWTALPATPDDPEPDWRTEGANPRLAAIIDGQRREYDIVLAADERLYIPCSAELTYWPGGMLGWYDPRSGEAGGTREGFETSRGHDVETACDGRYVLCSTVPWPPESHSEAAVVIYDTQLQRGVGRVRLPGDPHHPSQILEWRTGQVVGYSSLGDEDWQFYLLDVETQELTTGPVHTCRLHGKLLVLPDGNVGFLDGSGLCRLAPDTWEISVVGQLPSPPRDWMRLGDELYVIIDTHLARVRQGCGAWDVGCANGKNGETRSGG